MKHLKFLFSIALTLFFGSSIGHALDIDAVIPTVGLFAAQAVIKYEAPKGAFLLSAVDTSALTAYAGKNAKKLIATMMNGLDAFQDVIVRPNVKNKLRIGKLDVANGVRPFSSTEEFGSRDLIYTDRFLEVNAAKRELHIDAAQYRETYLSEFMQAGTNAKNATKLPFEAWTWREVLKSVWREVNNQIVYDGFDVADAVAYAGGSTYSVGDYIAYTLSGQVRWYKCIAATSAGQNPETNPEKWADHTAAAVTPGFGKIIADEITASNITPIGTGAIDATQGVAFGAFKEMYQSMPKEYRKHGVIINCSQDDFDLLIADLRHFYQYTQKDTTAGQSIDYMVLPETNGKCIVKNASWITGRRMIAGPSQKIGGNWKNAALLAGTDLVSDMNQINHVQSELWKLKAGLKFVIGFEIANLDEIRVNDQL